MLRTVMANLNKVLLLGNLTRDPELRYTPKGTAVADLSIAVNRRVSDGAGNWTDETTFVDVTVWGNTAENSQKYLTKGRGVFVEGRLQLDTWEDKQSGQKRSKLKVVGETVQFLPDARGGGVPNGGGGSPSPSARPAGGGYANPPQGGSAGPDSDYDDEGDDIPF
ncbi:single-strand DNA-binding protein [Haloferula luteola]|uniref:Single-stranded DNA-binding protein n=1 Tax=Haloferula luteola TaxID=595692 RepID=A0A840V1A6_9BACT|nr:single-stranded DNA-binding protein [Haloferula luteola]MBB5350846.1 single-strand DNA-binding protein [Haloferula luteola]